MNSQFKFHHDLLDDFLYGDCEILAFYLYQIMKQNKIKSKVYATYNKSGQFIHVLVYYKGRYIDILGIHNEDEVFENHKKLYNIDSDDVEFCLHSNKEWENRMISNKEIEPPIYWESAYNCAECIYYSSIFQQLLHN